MAEKDAVAKVRRQRVDFVFCSDEAENVFLAGDFNEWDTQSHPMKPDGTGAWRKHLFLVPGTYEYKFLSSGDWWVDPENPLTCPNCHGTRNSFVVVCDREEG